MLTFWPRRITACAAIVLFSECCLLPRTLDKGISLEQVEQAVRLSREAGLQTIGYFMIGSPDVDVIGTDAAGKELPIISRGRFAV